MKNAKKTNLNTLLLSLAALCCACLLVLGGCTGGTKADDTAAATAQATTTAQSTATTTDDALASVWTDAVYTEDTAIGKGSTVFELEVKVGSHNVTFTVSTDKTTLGAALVENDLVVGDKGDYGLYINKVNGMTADYDVNGAFWSIEKSGEMLMTGADDTPIASGEHFELVYSK